MADGAINDRFTTHWSSPLDHRAVAYAKEHGIKYWLHDSEMPGYPYVAHEFPGGDVRDLRTENLASVSRQGRSLKQLISRRLIVRLRW